MAFWDDIVNFFGGGNRQETKPAPATPQPSPPKDWARNVNGAELARGGLSGQADRPAQPAKQGQDFWGTFWNASNGAPNRAVAQYVASDGEDKGMLLPHAGRDDKITKEADAAKTVEEQRRKDRTAQTAALGQVSGQKQLSWDEYNMLNARQRAAVDANTALLKAVQDDKTAGGVANDEYSKNVEGLFGKDGGSDTYAPRTVALLQKMGVKSSIDDLDNYLNLNALVTDKDLEALAKDATPAYVPGVGSASTENSRIQHARVFSQAAVSTLAETLAAGQNLLDSLNGDTKTQLGFDPTNERDVRLQTLFNTLRQQDDPNLPAEQKLQPGDLEQVLGGFQQNYGLDSQAVFDYFEKRLRQSEYEGVSGRSPKTDGPVPQYLDSAEFRKRYYTGGN